MITCIAVDDEPLALKVIRAHAARIPFLDLREVFTDAQKAITYLGNNPIDLLFLDIQMPGITGIELLKQLKNPPLVIFTTAHEKYAVEGFNLDARDYLLKPIEFERFLKAIGRVENYLGLLNKHNSGDSEALFVKSEYRILKINLADIEYIESLDDYVKIYTGVPRPVLTLSTLKSMYDKLPAEKFIRVHRSYIVPFQKVESVRNRRIKIGEKTIPLGDSYYQEFMSRFKPT